MARSQEQGQRKKGQRTGSIARWLLYCKRGEKIKYFSLGKRTEEVRRMNAETGEKRNANMKSITVFLQGGGEGCCQENTKKRKKKPGHRKISCERAPVFTTEDSGGEGITA